MFFEVHEGRQSTFLFYERVLKVRACGRRVVNQAMVELDDWRKEYGRLFELLDFADWRELIVLLDKLRGERPQRSRAHTRARKDQQYAQDTFYRAISAIDAWRRTYENVFEHWKHADGRRIIQAIDGVCNPEGGRVLYVWKTDE